MTRSTCTMLVALGALGSLCALGRDAQAAGLATARFGGEHGTPMTSNPTAIYYNPGGIARSEGFNLFVDGTMALRGISYERDPAPTDVPEPADAQGANNGSTSTFNVSAAPMAGLTFKIPGEDVGFALGAAFFVPFGGGTVWPENKAFQDSPTYAGAMDGIQRWYSIQGSIRSMCISGTAAISIVDRLYFGVSGNAYSSIVDTIRARLANGSNDVVNEGRSRLDVKGWHGGLGIGLLGEAIEDELLIGASYQSQPGFGDMKLRGTLRNNFTGTVTPDEVELTEAMPDIVRLGASYRPLEDLELRLFGDFTRWSVLKNQCIASFDDATGEYKPCDLNEDGSAAPGSGAVQSLVRDWNDSFGIRAGASYWPMEELELYGGLGYDSNAIPAQTLDPAILDFHDISVALGAKFAIADFLQTALTYTHFFYIPRDTSGKAKQATMVGPSRGPDSGGRYSQWVGAINLNVQVAYDPF
jgi:long-chain fatty acid transport protein